MSSINIDDMTPEQLEQLESDLKKKKEKEKKALEKKKAVYLQNRDNLVVNLVDQAEFMSKDLKAFKDKCVQDVDQFIERMREYGDVKENGRGHLTITTQDGKYRVAIETNHLKVFDERAQMAEQKLKEFLTTFVKKRDKNAYELVYGLLEKNSKGDYDFNLIQRLYKMEDKFDHDLWKDAIKLFKESYNEQSTRRYIRFYKQDENGGCQNVSLQFSSL